MEQCYCEATDYPFGAEVGITKFVYDDRYVTYRSLPSPILEGKDLSDATHQALIAAAEKHYDSLNRRERLQRKYRFDRTTPLDCNLCKHRMACIAMSNVVRVFEAR